MVKFKFLTLGIPDLPSSDSPSPNPSLPHLPLFSFSILYNKPKWPTLLGHPISWSFFHPHTPFPLLLPLRVHLTHLWKVNSNTLPHDTCPDFLCRSDLAFLLSHANSFQFLLHLITFYLYHYSISQ